MAPGSSTLYVFVVSREHKAPMGILTQKRGKLYYQIAEEKLTRRAFLLIFIILQKNVHVMQTTSLK